uniref:hypothetical protein n=1 Tax=Streptomyces hawaiiensis TaxID=67305 RepID=UPI0031DCF113
MLVGGRTPLPGLDARSRALDLHHVRTEIGEERVAYGPARTREKSAIRSPFRAPRSRSTSASG